MVTPQSDRRDLFVPDGVGPDNALARTTDLGIGAHPDDLEFLMLVPIATAFDDPHRWFTGITCTDGAGCARAGELVGYTDVAMAAVRRDEQCAAAIVGRYSAIVQLGHSSADVRGAAFGDLITELADLIAAAGPQNVYTHNLADKHTTHLAVGLATVFAIRSLPAAARPFRLVGVEGWRDLDWLPDHEKVTLDATGFGDMARRLADCFPSQLAGKRYDQAAEGRRRANATMSAPRANDDAEEVIVAFDLSPLIRNDDLDPVTFVTSAIDRFRAAVAADLDSLLRGSGIERSGSGSGSG